MEYSTNTEDKREKMQALSLAKECYSMKLDLLTNATVVDDVIRFVSHKSPDDRSKEGANEPNYHEDKDQLEEEQEEEEAEKTTTTNLLF
jgi:hypothetical protein